TALTATKPSRTFPNRSQRSFSGSRRADPACSVARHPRPPTLGGIGITKALRSGQRGSPRQRGRIEHLIFNQQKSPIRCPLIRCGSHLIGKTAIGNLKSVAVGTALASGPPAQIRT